MHPDHPFSATHSQRLMLTTEARRDALARVCARLGTREPFLLITGESGTGKTALMLDAIAQWRTSARVATITEPGSTPVELLETIARSFGVEPPENPGRPQLLEALERVFAECATARQVPIVLIEDAHELAPELLEELRLLANAATEAHHAFEVALVGLPPLEARLATPALEPLLQRVSVRCQLQPLSHKETRRYLHHRMSAVGSDGPRTFPRETCREIHHRARGIPRAINTLATEAMRRAREDGTESIAPAHVRAAAAALWVDAAAMAANPVAGTSVAATTPEPVAEPASPDSGVPVDGPRSGSAPGAPEFPAPPARADATPDSAPVTALAPPPEPVAFPLLPIAPPPEFDRSENPRVREWVHRFLGNQGPPLVGVGLLPDPDEEGALPSAPRPRRLVVSPPRELPPSKVTPPSSGTIAREEAHAGAATPASALPGRGTRSASPPAAEASATTPHAAESAASIETPPPTRSRAPRAPRAPRHHARRSGRLAARLGRLPASALSIALVLLAALATVILYPRGQHSGPRAGRPAAVQPGASPRVAERPTAAIRSSAPQPRPVRAAPAGEVDLDGEAIASIVPPLASDPPRDDALARPLPVTVAARSPAGEPARHDAPRRPLPVTVAAPPPSAELDRSESGAAGRLTLDVGTYLDATYALAQRERLRATTGLEAWIVTDSEGGTESHHVILGVYRSPERAEAAANLLLGRGLVSQASVVPLPARRVRH